MFENLTTRKIVELTPYIPGKPIEEVQREYKIPAVIKLASNENPLGPSPRALEGMRKILAEIHRYPDASCYYLKEKLAKNLNVQPKQLIIGNGSHEVMTLLVRTFVRREQEVITAEKAFVIYKLLTLVHDGVIVEVPQTPSGTFDLEKIAAKVTSNTRLIFIANPNNPTGTYVPTEQVIDLLKFTQGKNLLVILDEAYHEFAVAPDYPNGLELLHQFPHLVVLRTFSKAYRLAGLRVGYGIGHSDVIHYLHQVKDTFNVNAMAQMAAMMTLDDKEHLRKSIQLVHEGVHYFCERFTELGLKYWPSEGNFVTVDIGRDTMPVNRRLMQEGVILRPLHSYNLPTHFRVTAGLPDENRRAIKTLKMVLEEVAKRRAVL